MHVETTIFHKIKNYFKCLTMKMNYQLKHVAVYVITKIIICCVDEKFLIYQTSTSTQIMLQPAVIKRHLTLSDLILFLRHHWQCNEHIQRSTEQKVTDVTAYGQIQELIVQYHVKTPRRYSENCSVFCQIQLDISFTVVHDARLPCFSCKSQKP